MDWRSSPECTALMPPMKDFSNSLLGYSTPLHHRKDAGAMVLGSALVTTGCRQCQGRITFPMLTIQQERHTETQYCQEYTRYDIYHVVVAQVDGRDHETHHNHQQGVKQSTLVPCRHGQDNDGYSRMATGESVTLHTFKGIQCGLERRGEPQASQGEPVVLGKIK